MVFSKTKTAGTTMENEISAKEGEDLFAVQGDAEIQKRSFIPAVFISAALPLRDTKRNVFIRKFNNITMKLTGASRVPFGKNGRLLLSVLTTHAVQEKNTENPTEIILRYDSLQQLLDEMQLPRQRGREVMEQLECFKECSFIYEEIQTKYIDAPSLFQNDPEFASEKTVKAEKISTGLIPFFEAMQYVRLTDKSENQRNMAFEIKLAVPFIKLSQKHSVPINYTSYKNITSALGKDLYAWFCYRNNSLGGEPLFVPRDKLVEQFMPVQNTNNPQSQESVNFNHIKEVVEDIKKKYYPELNVSFPQDGSGMYLRKSPPIMLPDDKVRYVLVTSDN
jgi:hypothetical protein